MIISKTHCHLLSVFELLKNVSHHSNIPGHSKIPQEHSAKKN